jgi:hypothetical protein
MMKSWLKSKTLWINGLISAAVAIFGHHIGLTGEAQVGAQGIILSNVGLRLGTNKKLTMKRAEMQFYIACILICGLASQVACAFKADNVAHEDGEKKTTIESVEGTIK